MLSGRIIVYSHSSTTIRDKHLSISGVLMLIVNVEYSTIKYGVKDVAIPPFLCSKWHLLDIGSAL